MYEPSTNLYRINTLCFIDTLKYLMKQFEWRLSSTFSIIKGDKIVPNGLIFQTRQQDLNLFVKKGFFIA